MVFRRLLAAARIANYPRGMKIHKRINAPKKISAILILPTSASTPTFERSISGAREAPHFEQNCERALHALPHPGQS
jgi:hypothetical protein